MVKGEKMKRINLKWLFDLGLYLNTTIILGLCQKISTLHLIYLIQMLLNSGWWHIRLQSKTSILRSTFSLQPPAMPLPANEQIPHTQPPRHQFQSSFMFGITQSQPHSLCIVYVGQINLRHSTLYQLKCVAVTAIPKNGFSFQKGVIHFKYII